MLSDVICVASPLTVNNASFETPAQGDGGFADGYNVVPGWIGSPTTGIQMGVENPFSSRYAQTNDTINDPHADGKQYLHINTYGVGEVAYFTSSALTTVAASTRYLLTVALGNGLDIHPARYEIDLLVNGTPIATKSLDGTTITPGTFIDQSVSFDSPVAGGTVGGSLQVRLLQTNDTGVTRPVQGHYDNVRVDASPVPEPTIVGYFAVIGTWVGRRRRDVSVCQ